MKEMGTEFIVKDSMGKCFGERAIAKVILLNLTNPTDAQIHLQIW